MIETQNFAPRTKYIRLEYHWFRLFVIGPNKLCNTKYTTNNEQNTDTFPKPLDETLFIHLKCEYNEW